LFFYFARSRSRLCARDPTSTWTNSKLTRRYVHAALQYWRNKKKEKKKGEREGRKKNSKKGEKKKEKGKGKIGKNPVRHVASRGFASIPDLGRTIKTQTRSIPLAPPAEFGGDADVVVGGRVLTAGGYLD